LGIKRILERVEKEEIGGVIWHTQGSGKEFGQWLMLTKALKREIL